jgi:uncharacterized membrane protein YcjF (UPF0283 family)
MPIPREIREELQRRHSAAHYDARRDTRRDFVRTALSCWGWMLAGLAMVAWSIHTSDERYARAVFWAGLGVGNAGIIFSILRFYRRGEARGDW